MSAYLWTMEALIAAMGGRAVGDVPKGVTGISIDSRSAAKGEAFFAIKGDTFDGHDFITAAMVSGASVCVVAESKIPALGKFTAPLIVVDDVLAGLERLALASRARTKAKIIAVTGSAGKTTTKEALRHCLSAVGTVHASAASFNNHWGVPLTMAKIPEDTQYGVFEVGMNHPGEIRNLIRFVQPHVAIVTIIAAAHLGFFKNLDEIADAKAEIFEGIIPGGTAILNRDDQRFRLLEHAAKRAGVANWSSASCTPRIPASSCGSTARTCSSKSARRGGTLCRTLWRFWARRSSSARTLGKLPRRWRA
jgi:UDP-N-acetylmuramoyl-tripeptide--D-alanyl-D-alanine ligase